MPVIGSKDYPLFETLSMSGSQEFFYTYLMVVISGGEVPTKTMQGLMKVLLGIGRALCDNTHRYIIHNIHTAGCFGLFILSRRMCISKESSKWENQSLKQLCIDVDRSYFRDLCHKERCWAYGYFTLWRLTLVYQFAMRTGGMGGREKSFLESIQRNYRWYPRTMAPGEMCPGFGDNGIYDGKQIIDWALRVYPKGTSRTLGEDVKKSYFMKDSGFAIMRNGSNKDSSIYSNLTSGDFAGWHGHFDCLSMNVWIGNTPIIDELGQFDSYGKPLDALVRAAESHNVVLIDGLPFDSRFCDGAHGMKKWYSDKRIDYFTAYHKAYRRIPDFEHRPYVGSCDAIVRRTVVFVKNPGYFVVMDSVRSEDGGGFNKAISAYWHSCRDYKVLGKDRVRTEGRKAVAISWAHPEHVRRLNTSTDYLESETNVCNGREAYGERHCLRVRGWADPSDECCAGFVTLIHPYVGNVPKTSIKAVADTGQFQYRAEVLEIKSEAGTDLIALNPEKKSGISHDGRDIVERAVIRLDNRRGTSVVT